MHTLHRLPSALVALLAVLLFGGDYPAALGGAPPAQEDAPTAEQEDQHNALTREEFEEGWILLFDGNTTFGWENHGGAEFRAEDGVLIGSSGSDGWAGTTTAFSDFVLRLQYRIDETGNSGIFFRSAKEGAPWETGLEMQIWDADENNPTGSLYGVARAEHPGGELVTGIDRWNDVEIRAEGTHVTITLNGEQVLDANVPEDRHSRAPIGHIGVQYHYPGMTVAFRDIKLLPLGGESIFNGANLDGWTVFPDRASVYTVTEEGYLNVTDGNGQIATEGRWADLVLQLDIISNGDHLNSGVFFRANPEVFWDGYESQVRNEWVSDVLLSDGRTLTGSVIVGEEEVQVRGVQDDGRRIAPTDEVTTVPRGEVQQIVDHRDRPVDFGTGGIYNQQPARFVVPSDREWYTMTVVAHGRHMAVWVNGIQVSDFTDEREPHESARQGYSGAAGSVTLQGHDPTTDLSFRNLRVAELPARP